MDLHHDTAGRSAFIMTPHRARVLAYRLLASAEAAEETF